MAENMGDNAAVAKTVGKLAIAAVAMFAFVFVVMVPLYNVLCDVLGLNGKYGNGRYTVEAVQQTVDTEREVTVIFVANNNAQMPWEFRPDVTAMKVHPGAMATTAFFARNPEQKAMVAQAIPSFVPARAAAYFHKTECFCFNQQPLEAGAQAEMPLQFIVDRNLPKDIHSITLSYTIFDVTEMAQRKDVAALK